MARPRTRRGWLTSEERILVEMWRAGESGVAIADALSRSKAGVYSHVAKNYKRLGIETRATLPWHGSEQRALVIEVELALKRLEAALPHRKRPTITQRVTAYLMGDAKRLKKAENAARIADIGGMAIDHAREFGARAERKPRKKAA